VFPAPGRVPTPPPEAWQRPVRVEPVPGTPYGLAILGAPSSTSGPAVGALVAGVAAALVSVLVGCFGVAGAGAGWGLWVSGAFAILAAVLGAAGVGLGAVAVRRIRRTGEPGRPVGVATPPRGRGMAVTGAVAGAAALVVTVGVLVVVIVTGLW
jgi:hypothetical protein